MQVNKILLTRNRPEQFSLFLMQFSVESNHYEMKPRFQSYHFLKKSATCVDSMLFHCFDDGQNFVSEYFENALKEFVQNFP